MLLLFRTTRIIHQTHRRYIKYDLLCSSSAMSLHSHPMLLPNISPYHHASRYRCVQRTWHRCLLPGNHYRRHYVSYSPLYHYHVRVSELSGCCSTLVQHTTVLTHTHLVHSHPVCIIEITCNDVQLHTTLITLLRQINKSTLVIKK